MINQKEDILNSFGKALIIVLFFLFVSSFSNKPAKQDCISRGDLLYELHSNPVKAIIGDAVQFHSYQKNQVSLLNKLCLTFFNENLRIHSDNRNSNQKVISLQIAQRSIKPIHFCRFYYHLFSADSKELPLIS